MTSMQTRRYLKQTVFVALNCVTGMTAALQLTESIDPVIVQHHVGKIIFVELLTPDLAASRQFYSSMFGWTYQTTTNGGSDYVEAWLNGSRVAGLQYKAQSVGRLRQPV